jgi:hypothetical protein
MAIGTVTITIQNGGLGQLPANNAQGIAILGCSSSGTNDVLTAESQPDNVVSDFGYGPMPRAAVYQLNVAGGTAYCMRVSAATAGTAGSVTMSVDATSTGVATLSGAPYSNYSVLGKITSTGTGQTIGSGTMRAQVSLDAGNKFGAEFFVPTGGTCAISNSGLTANLNTGTWAYGDTFSATCKNPEWDSSGLTTAFAALAADTQPWSLIHLVGYPQQGAASANLESMASLHAALDVLLAGLTSRKKFVRCLMNAPACTKAELIASSLTTTASSDRIMVNAPLATVANPLDGYALQEPWSTVIAGRLAQIPPSQSPGEPLLGKLLGVTAVTLSENTDTGIYDYGYCVAQRIPDFTGFYCDRGNVKCDTGSDYNTIMNGRVIDLVCRNANAIGYRYLNARIKVDKTTGKILDSEASAIEAYFTTQLRTTCGTEFSGISVAVNRNENLLTTKTLTVTISVVPFGYAENVEITIGLTNPTILPLAA